MYTCVYVYIYIAESDSIYSFSPNPKMGVVYFGWKRHGSGVCPIPYGFHYLSCGLDQNNLCLLGRYFTSVHVRPSVCVVYFILSGDVQGAAPQFGKTTRMLVYLWALGVFFTQLAEVRTA